MVPVGTCARSGAETRTTTANRRPTRPMCPPHKCPVLSNRPSGRPQSLHPLHMSRKGPERQRKRKGGQNGGKGAKGARGGGAGRKEKEGGREPPGSGVLVGPDER